MWRGVLRTSGGNTTGGCRRGLVPISAIAAARAAAPADGGGHARLAGAGAPGAGCTLTDNGDMSPDVPITEVGRRPGPPSIEAVLPTAARKRSSAALHAAGLREIDGACLVPEAALA